MPMNTSLPSGCNGTIFEQTLTLLNGTEIPYKQLTIPCCSECNNVHLGKMEQHMKLACDPGHRAVAGLPR
jgi:hypothetical protein